MDAHGKRRLAAPRAAVEVARLYALGFEPPAAHTAAEFAAFVRTESAEWEKVAKTPTSMRSEKPLRMALGGACAYQIIVHDSAFYHHDKDRTHGTV